MYQFASADKHTTNCTTLISFGRPLCAVVVDYVTQQPNAANRGRRGHQLLQNKSVLGQQKASIRSVTTVQPYKSHTASVVSHYHHH